MAAFDLWIEYPRVASVRYESHDEIIDACSKYASLFKYAVRLSCAWEKYMNMESPQSALDVAQKLSLAEDYCDSFIATVEARATSTSKGPEPFPESWTDFVDSMDTWLQEVHRPVVVEAAAHMTTHTLLKVQNHTHNLNRIAGGSLAARRPQAEQA